MIIYIYAKVSLDLKQENSTVGAMFIKALKDEKVMPAEKDHNKDRQF